MEALIALFALGVAGVLIAMPIVALVALTRANRALHELEQLRNRMEAPGAARGCGASQWRRLRSRCRPQGLPHRPWHRCRRCPRGRR